MVYSFRIETSENDALKNQIHTTMVSIEKAVTNPIHLYLTHYATTNSSKQFLRHNFFIPEGIPMIME